MYIKSLRLTFIAQMNYNHHRCEPEMPLAKGLFQATLLSQSDLFIGHSTGRPLLTSQFAFVDAFRLECLFYSPFSLGSFNPPVKFDIHEIFRIQVYLVKLTVSVGLFSLSENINYQQLPFRNPTKVVWYRKPLPNSNRAFTTV